MKIHKEYIRVTATLVATAFGVAAGLAWNNAITAIFNQVFGTTEGVAPDLIYAIVITVIAVTATVLLARAASKVTGEDIELKVAK